MSHPFAIRQLTSSDLPLMHKMLALFGEVFGDVETYSGRRPGTTYLERLLGGDSFIALAALDGDRVIGALAAYELCKFEQERSEIYIYDLAVSADRRRIGVATALIRELQTLGARRGAYVIFVQADQDDAPAIALYAKLGVHEDVLHFDIPTAKASLAKSPECAKSAG